MVEDVLDTEQVQGEAAVEPDAPAAEEPKPPPGLCAACGASVPRDKIEHLDKRPPLHRAPPTKHQVLGDLCGPVVTEWWYRIVYQDQTCRFRVQRRTCPMPIEQALDFLEQLLTPEGEERVVIVNWTLQGTK